MCTTVPVIQVQHLQLVVLVVGLSGFLLFFQQIKFLLAMRVSQHGEWAHVEADDFDGDCVLANSFLFLEDFGWWIKATYVVPKGNMGCVL